MSINKPIYSIEAPDQPRLKAARLEIEALLAKHDLAAVVVLHTPGMAEFFHRITPSYSVCSLDETEHALLIKSKRYVHHSGNSDLQLHDQAATANMTRALAGTLLDAAGMFNQIDAIVTKTLGAEHTGPRFVLDPLERLPQ